MNIQQINDNLQIKDFLEKLQIYPAHVKGNDCWYISPIRETESTPSFKINTKLNRWYDYAIGEGGKLFDLARRLYQSNDLSEVIGKVTSLFLITANNPHTYKEQLTKQENTTIAYQANTAGSRQREPPMKSPKILIRSVEPLGKSYSLNRYLNERKISRQTATAYCKEISFSISDKNYSAIGFENRSGGYELRNDWFKGSSSPKDITFIAGGSNAVCLVEGFMDFLSLLELREQLHLNANFLILNSVALLNKSLEILKAHRDVFLFLDHDKAGKETAEKLLLAGINGIDSSGFYGGFKDVNEYLTSQQPTSQKRSFGRR